MGLTETHSFGWIGHSCLCLGTQSTPFTDPNKDMCPGPAFLSACPCLDLPIWPLQGCPTSLPGPMNREVVELAHYLVPCHSYNKVTTKLYKLRKGRWGKGTQKNMIAPQRMYPLNTNLKKEGENCSEQVREGRDNRMPRRITVFF